jgi:transposase
MQDHELYQQILGLKTPWSVSKVALDVLQQQVDVFVEHPSGTKFRCPECSLQLPCCDHTRERQWRHLDSCQFKTILNSSIPRLRCPEHGVKQVQVRGRRREAGSPVSLSDLRFRCFWQRKTSMVP